MSETTLCSYCHREADGLPVVDPTTRKVLPRCKPCQDEHWLVANGYDPKRYKLIRLDDGGRAIAEDGRVIFTQGPWMRG